MMSRQEREPASRPAWPAWWPWGLWLFGPATFGFAFVVYVVVPEFYYGDSRPGPDPCLALLMVTSHGIAGIGTLCFVLTRGPHRGTAEFWLLILYWLSVGGWILLGVGLALAVDASTAVGVWCARVGVTTAVVMPVVGLVRGLVRKRRARLLVEP